MADIIIYDTESGKVKDYMKSVNTPDFKGRNDVLFNPEIPVGVPLQYLKVDRGTVLEMNATEKSTIDKIAKDSIKLEVENKIQEFDISAKEIIKAFIQVVNLRFPKQEITENEIIAQIKINHT